MRAPRYGARRSTGFPWCDVPVHEMAERRRRKTESWARPPPTGRVTRHVIRFGIGPTVEMVPANGRHANGNGHHDDAEEPQQTLFSWAEFMAEEPVKPKRRSKPQPASMSMFEWALELEQQREAETVGAGR